MKIKTTKTSDNNRITALIYGQSGSGKTTLARTLSGKTLIISAESGLLSLKDYEIDVVEIDARTPEDKIGQLRSLTVELVNGTDYDNIFIDSLTEISQIFVEHFNNVYPDRKNTLALWGDYAKSMRSFIKTLRDLAPYNVIMTALEKDDKDDLSRKVYMPDLNGRIATQVCQFYDEVFNLRVVKKDEEERRYLITDPIDGIMCKDRSGKLDRFEEADLSVVFNKIKGVTNV